MAGRIILCEGKASTGDSKVLAGPVKYNRLFAVVAVVVVFQFFFLGSLIC